MFSIIFDGQGEPGVNCPSHDGARQEANGAGTQRHRGPFHGISRGIAVSRYVRGQRLSPQASIRHPRHECGRHPRRREAFHCRDRSYTSFPERQRSRIHKPSIRGILQQPRDPTRAGAAIYTSTKWARAERTPESLQSRTRGTSGSLEHSPGHSLGRSQGLYRRGGN